MKLIGITSSSTENRSFLNKAYLNAFTRPDVLPIMLPQFPVTNREVLTQEQFNLQNKAYIDKMVGSLDGLVISGGTDINPTVFDDKNWGSSGCDSERDMMEIALVTAFILADKPIMGICRGFQLLGQYMGVNNFFQNLSSTKELHSGTDRDFKDRQEPCHNVFVLGRFQEYLQQKTNNQEVTSINVNSWHHQGFTLTADGQPYNHKFKVRYPDWLRGKIDEFDQDNDIEILACTGVVVEAFERREAKIFGVQWHPEEYGSNGLTIQYWIDNYLNVEAEQVVENVEELNN